MSKSIEDLLVNERFRKYVLNPNQGDHDYWEEWSNENEDNKSSFEEAIVEKLWINKALGIQPLIKKTKDHSLPALTPTFSGTTFKGTKSEKHSKPDSNQFQP